MYEKWIYFPLVIWLRMLTFSISYFAVKLKLMFYTLSLKAKYVLSLLMWPVGSFPFFNSHVQFETLTTTQPVFLENMR